MTLHQAEIYLLSKNKKITYINYSLNDSKFFYDPEVKIQKSENRSRQPFFAGIFFVLNFRKK